MNIARPLVLSLICCALSAPLLHAADGGTPSLVDQAEWFRHELDQKVLPYWFKTAQDNAHGGYILADSLSGPGHATEKQLVTQSRMIWGFAHAFLHGFRSPDRDDLAAARQGYRFLIDHFLDREHGGFYWKTDLHGRVISDRKVLYGESFVIYALVELHRATRDPEPLERAVDLYRTLQEHAHDDARGGWIEHFQADWTPILSPQSGAEVEIPGYKSANAHLHLMEALTELYDVSRDPAVKESLLEALRINTTFFYPPDPAQSAFHQTLDWQRVTAPSSSGLSYGHNVEFAWLMIRAQRVLGQEPDWRHFYRYLNHALRYGYDHQPGGLYSRGADDQPATDTAKIWWVEAEMMAILTDALQHRPNAGYRTALLDLIDFLRRHQIQPKDGIWLDTVTADGTPKSPGKAHNWKANYHDVRAMIKFIEAFGAKKGN